MHLFLSILITIILALAALSIILYFALLIIECVLKHRNKNAVLDTNPIVDSDNENDSEHKSE